MVVRDDHFREVTSRSYEDRVANIFGTGSGPRDNGDFFLTPGANTFNDRNASDPPATTLVDEVLGGDDSDWMLLDEVHDTDDRGLDELVADLVAFPIA